MYLVLIHTNSITSSYIPEPAARDMCEISSYACPWRFQAPQVLHMSSFHLPVIVDIGYYLPWLISTQYPFTWVCLKNYAKQIPEFGKSLNHFPMAIGSISRFWSKIIRQSWGRPVAQWWGCEWQWFIKSKLYSNPRSKPRKTRVDVWELH